MEASILNESFDDRVLDVSLLLVRNFLLFLHSLIVDEEISGSSSESHGEKHKEESWPKEAIEWHAPEHIKIVKIFATERKVILLNLFAVLSSHLISQAVILDNKERGNID